MSTRKRGILVEVDGMGEVDEVTQRIFDALDVIPESRAALSFLDRGVEIKTREQIATMRRAGLVVGETLALLGRAVRAGVTTGELDAIAEDNIRSAGATPSFKGYHGFPGSICTSVNDEVVHGIPGGRVIQDGDIVSIDCGAIVDGWHGDAALTFAVGDVAAAALELMRVTEESMWRGIAAASLGGRVTDISHAVETYIRSQGDYGILEEYVGHGIGIGDAPAARTCRTTGGRARARSWSRAWPWPSSRW